MPYNCQSLIGIHRISTKIFISSRKEWRDGISFKEDTDDDDTRLEYLLNFLGPIRQRKHEQWIPTGATEATRSQKKKSASEFMKHLHESMDHPVSQRCRIYQLEEIRIKMGETPDELV